MLLPGENSPKTWLFLTVLLSSIIAFSETTGGKTLDIKIGFDLTQGSNGAPSLRIRDFEDSTEYNPRAVEEASGSSDVSSKKVSPKGAESSESEERELPKKEESSKEPAAKPPKSSGSSDTDDEENSAASKEEKQRSTRALKAAEFEPEEANPKIHARYQKDSGSEASDG